MVVEYGAKEAVNEAIKDLSGFDRWVAEGCLGFRLVRRAVREATLAFDAVVVCPAKRVEEKHAVFCKGLTRIWRETTPLLQKHGIPMVVADDH